MKYKFTFLLFFTSFILFAQNEFITLWKPGNASTHNQSAINEVYFPGIGQNYTIYWEEVGNPTHNNTITNVTSAKGSPKFISFGNGLIANPTYIIKVSNGNGSFSSFSSEHGDYLKVIDIIQWGNIQWTSLESAFSRCSNLNYTATDIPNLSQVTNIRSLFMGTFNFTGNSSIANWNTSTITNMAYVFAHSNFNQDISLWNTSNVTNMAGMFERSPFFNQNISNWDTSKVEDMMAMFWDAKSFNQNIENWNTSKVKNMMYVFADAIAFNQNLGKWNLKNITDIRTMLRNTKLSCDNYNKTLIGWANNPETPMNLLLNENNITYSSQEASNARNYLMNTKGWIISGDNYNSNCLLATTENQTKKIQAYPNPVRDFILIDNLKNNTDFEIYDMQGKLIKRDKYNNSQISVKNLSKGIYILKIPSENYSQKLIVK